MRLRFPHPVLLTAPYAIFGFGILLNVLAITVNQGYMPVASSSIFADCGDAVKFAACIVPAPGDVIDEIHRAMQSSDHLKILCDWIQLPRTAVCSPGDLFLWLGQWLEKPALVTWLAILWKEYND